MTCPKMHLVQLTCHDYLFFASRDYGSSAMPANMINNYALMYAINRDVSPVHRLISKCTPHYIEDLPRMRTYTTAAYSSSHGNGRIQQRNVVHSAKPMIGNHELGEFYGKGLARFTWNSIGESLLDAMTQDGLNIPKTGVYYKHKPLSTFHFFAVGDDIPSVARVGKKYIPVRLRSTELELTIKDGIFEASCPVTVADLPEETEILEGSFITIPPTPLLVSAKIRGRHFEAKDDFGKTHRIPVPLVSRYESSIGRMEGIT